MIRSRRKPSSAAPPLREDVLWVVVAGLDTDMRVQLGDLSAERMRVYIKNAAADMRAAPHSPPVWIIVDSPWHSGPKNVQVRVDAVMGLWVEE